MTLQPWRVAALLIALSFIVLPAAADDVLIFAAASTAPALEENIQRYGETSTDRVRASYASSGALARQLDNGAPASLYLSANTKWLDWVEKKNLLAPKTRMDLLQNRLVLVEPNGAAIRPVHRDLLGWLSQVRGNRRLAIADPAHAPAGEYAKIALTSLGLWQSLSGRTVRARDVRAALLLVERQEASFGIIYRTDAQSSHAVRILAAFPEDSHPPILYGLAIIRNMDKGATRRFYDFLKSPRGQIIFRRYGFLTP